MGGREMWRMGNGALEQTLGLGVVVQVETIEMPQAPLIALPDIKIIGRQALRPLPLDLINLRPDGGNDGLGNLVLYGEYIGQVAVITFGPDMVARDSADLGRQR